MSEPSLYEKIISNVFAPGRLRRKADEQEKRDRLLALSELETLNNSNTAAGLTGPVDAGMGMKVELPDTAMTPSQEAEVGLLQNELGIKPEDAVARQRSQDLMRLMPQLPVEQQVDVLNDKSITSAAALAPYRQAQTREVELRNKALATAFSNDELDPLISADIANKKEVGKSQRVMVRGKDGKSVFYDAKLQPNGAYSYSPSMAGGEPLRVPPSGDGTTLSKDVALIQRIMNVPEQEALKYKLQLKSKSPEDAWSDLILKLASADHGRLARSPDRLLQQAQSIFAMARPGQELPEGAEALALGLIGGEENNQTGSETAAPIGTENATDAQFDARRRAVADGYDNLGAWLEGKGWEVLDESGKLIGYYN